MSMSKIFPVFVPASTCRSPWQYATQRTGSVLIDRTGLQLSTDQTLIESLLPVTRARLSKENATDRAWSR